MENSSLPDQCLRHFLLAALFTRIYEMFPLLCPMCAEQIWLIAYIIEGAKIRKILDHIGGGRRCTDR